MAKLIGIRLMILTISLGVLSSCAYTTQPRVNRYERMIVVEGLLDSDKHRMVRYFRSRARTLDCESFVLIEVVEGSHAIGLCIGHTN